MYVDLVFCEREDGKALACAPAFENLKGKEVIVKTKNGSHQKAVVVDSVTIDTTSNEFNFILTTARETKPLSKVVSVINYKELKYDEEMGDLINGIDND